MTEREQELGVSVGEVLRIRRELDPIYGGLMFRLNRINETCLIGTMLDSGAEIWWSIDESDQLEVLEDYDKFVKSKF